MWNERVDVPLPDEKIILDGDCPGQGGNDLAVGSIKGLPVDYTNLEGYIEKSMFLLDDTQDIRCTLCSGSIAPNIHPVVVCPHTHCRGVHHLICLSEKFLETAENPDILIPSGGVCPVCDTHVSWPLMIKELSLRNRAELEFDLIPGKKGKLDRKENAETSSSKESGRQASVEPSQGALPDQGCPRTTDDPLLHDDWYEQVDMESDTEHGTQKHRSPPPPSRLEIVIEDSDWDDAEIIE